MKKIITTLLIVLAAALAPAATVPLYLSGDAGAAYAVTAAALVTTTNTSTLYTNVTIAVTNAPDGVDGDTLYVAWRATTKAYIITNATPIGDQIARSTNLPTQAFLIMAKLQSDFPLANIGNYSSNSFTITAAPDDNLVVTNSPTYFNVTTSTSYNTATAAGTVTLLANPATLVTNRIIYVSGLTTNGAGAVTALTFATNTIVISQ